MIFGFIGIGNMGSVLAEAACRSEAAEILISDKDSSKVAAVAARTGARPADNKEIVSSADFIVLGVKPQMLSGLFDEIRPGLQSRKTRFTLVSMAAGVSIARLRGLCSADYPIIRIMPNTPCSTGEGIIMYHADNTAPEGIEEFLKVFAPAGRLMPLSESLIDTGTAVAGCGPAYADLFVEALADGAVACGFPRAQAQELAAQMLLGSAKLILESGSHPGDLKDAVCSPGGSTIQGVRKLEQGNFRSTVIEAVIAADEKNKNML